MDAIDDFALHPDAAVKPSDAVPQSSDDLFDVLQPVPAADVSHVELGSLVELDERAYNADQTAVRKSWLDYIDHSPAHLQAYRAGLMPPTEAMLLGSLLHTFVLEPHLAGGRFYREPELGNRNSKVVKEQLAALAAENPGRVPIREKQYDAALAMREAVYAHPAAKKLLEYDGYFERSIFWNNADTSEKCKARYDKVAPKGNFICDVKTTLDASPAEFAKSIVNYRYDCQVSHYTEPTGLRFVFIAVEKSPPYGVAVYAAGDDTLRLGQRRRLPNLRTYAECRAKNVWPGYPPVIQRLELPPWAMRAA